MTTPQTHARNASLEDMVQILRSNRARRVDIVAPVTAIRAEQGLLVVTGAETDISLEHGVGSVDGRYLPTAVCDDGISDRLGIGPAYLRRARNRDNIRAWDNAVNDWLTHGDYSGRQFLVRAYRGDDGQPGVGRAFLSDSYDPSADDLDVIMAALEGVAKAGVPIDIRGCSVTDRRVYVRAACEAVAVNAHDLVKNYRSPFSGKDGTELPLAFAGFEIGNSEVGLGRFFIAPRVELQVCSNGMTRRVDAFERQHLGRKLQAGVIKWSADTQRANLELITSKTADAVRTFLSPEYVQSFIDELATQAGVPVAKPEETIKHIVKELRYNEAQQDAILSMFIKSGD